MSDTTRTMSDTKYSALTTTALVIAVGSAILFDRAGGWHWLVGLVGIAAGLTATVTYFYNHRTNPVEDASAERESSVSSVAANSDELRTVDQTLSEWIGNAQRELWAREPMEGAVLASFHHDRIYHYYRRRLATAVRAMEPTIELPVELSKERLLVDEIVEIVNKLSPTCEFELSLEGHLAIRPRSLSKMPVSLPEPDEPQLESDSLVN